MAGEERWAKWAGKYTIHKETVEDQLFSDQQGWKTFTELTLEEARIQSALCSVNAPGSVVYDGLIEEKIIPVDHLKDGVPVSIYRPTKLPAVPLIVVFYHGGGLVLGNRSESDACMKRLAMMLPAILINVEYRLLPHPDGVLAPFNDCVAATEWVVKNKTVVYGQQNSKVAIIGSSAGGQIASSVTHSIKEGIDFQVMVYPVTDVKCEGESFREFVDLPGFSTPCMLKFIEAAGIGTEEMANNPRVNPAARKDLETCPPTLIILAPLDPIRDWGVDFADKLRAAGVDTELVIVDGVTHGFFTSITSFPTKSVEGHNHLKRFLEARM